MHDLPTLRLNNKADYRLRNGHLWIYSNEIDNTFFALKNIPVGGLACIENAAGKFIGLAYINPNTLICGRILKFNDHVVPDLNYFITRIKNALSLRQRIFTANNYRLIYGEGDYLPGLVVDRFHDTLVVQIATAGMENFLDLILSALDTVVKPKAIFLKNDGKMRAVEGIADYVRWHKGDPAEVVELEENGVKFIAPVLKGQKTGWFYDHRMARARLSAYVVGKRVLDVFSYIGGWGVQAGVFGAKEVICTDISDFALEYVKQNAQLNNLSNVTTVLGDAFSVMEDMHNAKEKFDVVILDPPAFIPRRKDLSKGLAAYLKANLYAMRLLAPDGILITGSCSMHLPAHELRQVIHKAAAKLNLHVQIIEQGHQGPDHPIHPIIVETEYLKSFIVRIAY